MQSIYRSLLVVLFVASGSSVSSGAIMVSYSGGSVSAGGTGVLDVLVSSNADPGTPDNLDSFSALFRIAPIGGAVVDGLQFVDPQAETQLGDGSYVFNTDSLGEMFGGPLGNVTTLVNFNDTYLAGDGTFGGTGFDLDNTTGTRLLFRLNLDATLANPGDQYTVSLIDDPSTDFVDSGFSSLLIHSDSYNGFTVTAVPEPATGVVLLGGSLAGFWWKRRRRNLGMA
jgi:PEP-CTERM motif